MTTSARQAEADRVELVYYWALQQMGNALVQDTSDLWSQVPADSSAGRSSLWLARVIEVIFGYRKEAHDLAVSYYRLVRALRTGYTVASGDESDGDRVSLNDLRDDFEGIVDHIDEETKDAPPANMGGETDVSDQPEPDLEPGDDDDDITVEDIGDIDDLIDQSNDSAMREAGTDLDAKGTENLLNKLAGIDDEDEAADQKSKQAHDEAGARGSAAAVRIMQNAARGLTYDLADTDLRVVAWARFSTTGDPCGWCAMLISRGAVYKSKQAAVAGAREDGTRGTDQFDNPATEQDKYHDNCRCVAVPIFGIEQFEGSMFDQNRYYMALWKKYIKGKYSGKDALSAWRKFLRDGFPGQEASAQAA